MKLVFICIGFSFTSCHLYHHCFIECQIEFTVIFTLLFSKGSFWSCNGFAESVRSICLSINVSSFCFLSQFLMSSCFQVQKWVVVISLLQGEIPERSIFRMPIHRRTLMPYLELTQGFFSHFLVYEKMRCFDSVLVSFTCQRFDGSFILSFCLFLHCYLNFIHLFVFLFFYYLLFIS